ncbi:MAG TPA: RNA polymerase sigma factor, partial [Vicinamibacteria bacterium]
EKCLTCGCRPSMDAEHEDPWGQLFALLGPGHDRALAFARRLSRSSGDGDDLFQEAVLRALRKLGDLRDPERFSSWFYSVIVSVHRNRGRRDFWRRFSSFGAPGRTEEAVADGHDLAEECERAQRMARALGSLPAVQREAVVLHDLEGFRVEEIARIQGGTASAVKSRLSRGRERLRRHYERLGIRPTPRLTEGAAHG